MMISPKDVINMKWKILTLIIAIIIAFAAFSMVKEQVHLNVWAEKIPDTEDIYLVCEICHPNNETIDTAMGKLNINLEDRDGNGIGTVDAPLDHGRLISRINGEYEKVNVEYDGGYIFKPCKYSNDLKILNSTNLTDDDITCGF